MPSSPLGRTDGRTASGVACHHRPWIAQTVGRRRAWHAIIALGQHTRSDDVGRCMPSSFLDQHRRSAIVGRAMPSKPLDSTHDQTASGVACHHRLWTAHTVKRRRVWHAIIAFRQHKRPNDVGRGMPSSPLGSTHSGTTSGVACHHRHWTSLHSWTASGVACHHRPWTANIVERSRVLYAIIAFWQH